MDIDFHYYATYVAARFAGYPADQALIIATAAQTIDENGRHVLVSDSVGMTTGVVGLPDVFEIRASGTGPALHSYRVQMTFQGLGDIGTSCNDTVASIWPVFHFLPGNFEPPRGLPSEVDGPGGARLRLRDRQGPAVYRSSRWHTRTLGLGSADVAVQRKFRWLCRPHSPMAIGIVNNATDLVHDSSSVVAQHRLEPYLVGATMHVFIDTWAHQDFVGPASKAINTVRGNPSYGYLPSAAQLPELTGIQEPSDEVTAPLTETRWRETAQGFNWIAGSALTDSGAEEKNIYVGHGQVGHWPDHAALIWKYHPNWSAEAITRVNPVSYFDAFVHMTWAMYCIRTRRQYAPFDLTESNLASLCRALEISADDLKAVYAHFSARRDPWGTSSDQDMPDAITDIWDRDIFVVGRGWRRAFSSFGLPNETLAEWVPGRSPWVMAAHRAHRQNQLMCDQKLARAGQWFSVAQFTSLDFFRFNLAAKCHYRFVKQQLLAFGEQLLGEWADGAAYADDLSFAAREDADAWLVETLGVLTTIQRETKLQALSEGMTVLISDVSRAAETSASEVGKRLRAVLGVLRDVEAAVDSEAKWTWGIREGAKNEISTRTVGIAGADALKRIKELIGKLSGLVAKLPSGPSAPSSGTRKVELMTYNDWKRESSVFFGSRDSDPELMYLDEAYKYLLQWLGGARLLAADDAQGVSRARMVVDGCDAWLEAKRGASGRTKAITELRSTILRCIDGG